MMYIKIKQVDCFAFYGMVTTNNEDKKRVEMNP